MGPLSKYWEILRLDPSDAGCGYKKQLLPLASEFFQSEFSNLIESMVQTNRSTVATATTSHQNHRTVQVLLHQQFMTQSSDLQRRAKAGLCLRGYVSYSILKACKTLANKFAATGQLTYQDLLPYVLNDDGEEQIVLNQDPRQQLILNHNGVPKQSTYPLFSVEVLRKFNPNVQGMASLDNWVHLQTRQNSELKKVLAERGFYKVSDWALLNRARSPQLNSLSLRERQIVEAFHTVYRRDRRKQQRNHLVCAAPTVAQLHEMCQYLQEKGVVLNLPDQLKTELKQIGQVLRQYAIWSSNGMPQSESLVDPYSGSPREFCDPNSINDVEQLAQQELREFCRQQLLECLDWGINRGICEHIRSLRQRPRYAAFASKVADILTLVYCHGQSQTKIASTLGMTNQSQVSRVLNPTTLLQRVRYWTVTYFFQMLSTKISSLNLATFSTDPDYLNNLMQHIEAFVDAEAFQVAFAEIKTAKRRSMNSLYAQRLRQYLEK